MTVDVKTLINGFGKTYQELFDSGFIPYKTKPKGDSGSSVITLDMAKEGVLLTFDKADQKLIEMTLRLIDERNDKYTFPNEMPDPLWLDISKPSVRERFGEPLHSHPPHKIINRVFGGVDYYELSKGAKSVMMLVRYNSELKAMTVTFKPAALVNWKPLSPSLLI